MTIISPKTNSKSELLSEYIREDYMVLRTEDFLTEHSRSEVQKQYSQYIQQEKIAISHIGLPYLVLNKRFEAGEWLGTFLSGIPCETKVFYYFELNNSVKPSKWLQEYPELLDSKEIYVRGSRAADWNDFLNCIWDFNKINTQVFLLDSNCVLDHPKSNKVIQSLLFRGVTLGFHGDFSTSWWQSKSRFIKMFADWGVLDFWQTKHYNIASKEFTEEKENKIKYFKFSRMPS
jgi:hypothetical protein